MTNLAIDGFEELSQQQMFDMAAAHLLQTGKRSYCQAIQNCSYAGSGCAAAVFLKEDAREDADDDGSWGNLVFNNRVPKHNSAFVAELQNAHDKSSDDDFLVTWKPKMLALAERFELDPSILNKDFTDGN
jgi:hypothetical protein